MLEIPVVTWSISFMDNAHTQIERNEKLCVVINHVHVEWAVIAALYTYHTNAQHSRDSMRAPALPG